MWKTHFGSRCDCAIEHEHYQVVVDAIVGVAWGFCIAYHYQPLKKHRRAEIVYVSKHSQSLLIRCRLLDESHGSRPLGLS